MHLFKGKAVNTCAAKSLKRTAMSKRLMLAINIIGLKRQSYDMTKSSEIIIRRERLIEHQEGLSLACDTNFR